MPRTQIQRKRLSQEWCLRMIFHIDNDNEDPLTGLRTDGAVWKSLSRQLLAHSHQADPVHREHHDDDEEKPGWQSLQCQWLHLNDMIIDADASVRASDGVFDNSLNLYYYFIYIIIIIIYKHKHICDTYFNINVQLVGDSVDHVDPDDPDAKAGRRTQTGFHHEVNLHLIIFVIHTSDLVYSNFCIIWLLLWISNAIHAVSCSLYNLYDWHENGSRQYFLPGPFCQSAFPARTRACNRRRWKMFSLA